MAEAAKEKTVVVEELDRNFCEEIAALPGGENIRKCFACGTCAAGCPVTNVDEAYNPRRIIRQILFGMRDEVLKSPVIWYCLTCYRCSARCPQDVNFSDLMRAIRYLAVKEGHTPGDVMSKREEIDNFINLMRRDIVKHTAEGNAKAVETLKAKVGELSKK